MNFRLLSYGSFIFLLFLTVLHENQTSEHSLTSNKNSTDFDKIIFDLCQVWAETLHIIKEKYYQNINPEKAMINALQALMKSLDPHSAFMDAKSYKEILENIAGEFPGIGIHVNNTKEPDDDFLLIIDTLPGGPAEKAQGTHMKDQEVMGTVIGLCEDDKIIEINGECLKGMALEDAILKIKGPRNSTVHLKVIRPGVAGIILFDITRDIVQEQNALCYHFNEHNIYYLSLNMFTENSVQQIEQLLQKSQQRESKALILDLRNNSGGALNSVIDIAGLFLPKNSTVVIAKDRNNQLKDKYATTREPIAQRNIPVFILVNNYTASAAEILAGCLQYYSQNDKSFLAFLVGTRTFGKGSVQEVIPISNNCALRLTIALYALANDVLIQGVGVQPDFEIEQRLCAPYEVSWFNKMFGRESSLKNSIKVDKNDKDKNANSKKNDPEKKWREKKEEIISKDYTILSTVRLIEMLDCARKSYPQKTRSRSDILTLLQNMYSPKEKLTMQEVKI